MRDSLAGAFAELVAHLATHRLDPGLHADLRDPGAHRAETDHAHPLHSGSAHPAVILPAS